MTVDELAGKYGFSRMDILHIDAESYDYKILRTVDLARFQPSLVIYESRHLDHTERAAGTSLLRSHGYEIFDDGENVWGWRPAVKQIERRGSHALEKPIMVPYDILCCAWPRPVAQCQGQWTSEPEWDAPLMHVRPQPQWRNLGGDDCWTIDWRELFRAGEGFGGEMCGFHIVFQIRVKTTGRLTFYSDDGCIIRRDGAVIHCDRAAHPAVRNQIDVEAGDHLEVAQWQFHRDWIWGARIDSPASAPDMQLRSWLPAIEKRLAAPDGPPLKMYCRGATPVRTVVSLYSMILNGYAPSAVHLYGDYQWPAAARSLFATLLPFAQVNGIQEVSEEIRSVGGKALVDMARANWFVMKSCVSLLCGPGEFCLMDDDIFILDDVGDALSAFQDCDFVFAPDADSEEFYQNLWRGVFGHTTIKPTASLNTGLYWLRLRRDRREIAELLLRGSGILHAAWAWEQGFFANLYADGAVFRLPPQRFFYPYFDGLPGGVTGYDYALNPCGFASVHFGGPVNKPGDAVAELLAPQILRPKTRARK